MAFIKLPKFVGPSGSQGTSTSGSTALSSKPAADPIQVIQELQATLPANASSLDRIIEGLNQRGIKAARATHANNTLVSDDAIVLGGGQVYDLLIGSSEANPRWAINDAGKYDAGRSVYSGGKFVPFSSWAGSSASGGGVYSPTGYGSVGPGGSALGVGLPEWGTPGAFGKGSVESRALAGKAIIDAFGKKFLGKTITKDITSQVQQQALEQGPSYGTENPQQMYSDAYAAMMQARKRARGSGRQSTIGAGFGGPAPLIAPATLIGGGR